MKRTPEHLSCVDTYSWQRYEKYPQAGQRLQHSLWQNQAAVFFLDNIKLHGLRHISGLSLVDNGLIVSSPVGIALVCFAVIILDDPRLLYTLSI